MLVRYKNMNVKPGGIPVVIPIGMKSASLMKRIGKVIWCKPFGELPEQDAIKLCEMDPYNFELVKEGEPMPSQHEIGTEIHCQSELAKAPKRRGRKRRVEVPVG